MTYPAAVGPGSWWDALRATTVGNRGEPSGESRLKKAPALGAPLNGLIRYIVDCGLMSLFARREFAAGRPMMLWLSGAYMAIGLFVAMTQVSYAQADISAELSASIEHFDRWRGLVLSQVHSIKKYPELPDNVLRGTEWKYNVAKANVNALIRRIIFEVEHVETIEPEAYRDSLLRCERAVNDFLGYAETISSITEPKSPFDEEFAMAMPPTVVIPLGAALISIVVDGIELIEQLGLFSGDKEAREAIIQRLESLLFPEFEPI